MDNISCSMILDSHSHSKNTFLQSRSLISWQPDAVVDSCCGCKCKFRLLVGKHHCRYCGYIYCSSCSNQTFLIPEFIPIPKPTKAEDRNVALRVCNYCYNKLNQIKYIKNFIKIFDLIDLTIKDILIMRQVCSVWRHYADYTLSQFRLIQYKVPYLDFNTYERNTLWKNRHFFKKHNIWMTQLLRSLTSSSQVREVFNLDFVSTSCSTLMCSRGCTKHDKIESIILLCDYKIKFPEIHHFAALSYLKLPLVEKQKYFIVLLENAVKSPFNELSKLCVKLAQAHDELAYELFWAIRIGLKSQDSIIVQRYNYIKQHLYQNMSNSVKTNIKKCLEFVEILENYLVHQDLGLLKSKLSSLKNLIHPMTYIPTKLKIESIKVGTSATKPLILEFEDGAKIMYKPEDIRKDKLVMNVISIMDLILKKEIQDLNIVTYSIQPTNINSGFIEFYPNCVTLNQISSEYGLSLLNYILDKNKSNQTIESLRQKFINSTAAYCAITYLLGAGDRHLNNIMITTDGRLFHIDYGYILGHDPKYLSNMTMRISDSIIDAIGGLKSSGFKDFSILCADKIYNCLRRHINTFAFMLNTLNFASPDIPGKYNQKDFENQINKRFLPGESYSQAEIDFHNRIDASTSKNLGYIIIDLFQLTSQSTFVKYFNNKYNDLKKYIFFSS